MVIYKNSTQFQQSWPWWRWILMGLITLAFILSAILSWHFLEGGSTIGCSGGSPCDQVLNSRWSILAGVLPVSGLAVGVYLAMFVASLFISPATEISIRRLAWSVMLVLAGSVVGSAIWFTILQKWYIGSFCPYCMTAHIAGLLLAGLVFWRAIREFENPSKEIPLINEAIFNNVSSDPPNRIISSIRTITLLLIGLSLAGIVAAFQVGFTSPAVYHDGEQQDNLLAIDYNSVPMFGSPDAPYVVTLLFDYQCSHCQKIHFMLDEVIHRYDGKLAFLLCPTPLNNKCNSFIPKDVDRYKNSCELAQIGLAVWSAQREKFPAFENWMFTFESGNYWLPRSIETARVKAIELVGKEEFEAAWSDPWIGQYLETCVQIYGNTIKSGNGAIPKLVFGSKWVVPEPYNADDLVMILQKSLDVPMP